MWSNAVSRNTKLDGQIVKVSYRWWNYNVSNRLEHFHIFFANITRHNISTGEVWLNDQIFAVSLRCLKRLSFLELILRLIYLQRRACFIQKVLSNSNCFNFVKRKSYNPLGIVLKYKISALSLFFLFLSEIILHRLKWRFLEKNEEISAFYRTLNVTIKRQEIPTFIKLK